MRVELKQGQLTRTNVSFRSYWPGATVTTAALHAGVSVQQAIQTRDDTEHETEVGSKMTPAESKVHLNNGRLHSPRGC